MLNGSLFLTVIFRFMKQRVAVAIIQGSLKGRLKHTVCHAVPVAIVVTGGGITVLVGQEHHVNLKMLIY